MKVHLCSPIGVPAPFPENEIPRLAAFLKSKGHEVHVADLKIKVLAKLKDIFPAIPQSFTGSYTEDITTQYCFLPAGIRVLRGKNNSRFLPRLVLEEFWRRVDRSLFSLARHPEGVETPKIKSLVDEEIRIWLDRIAVEKPDLIGFSFFPRKLYELQEGKDGLFKNYRFVELLWCVILAGMVKEVTDAPVWIGCPLPQECVYPVAQELFKRENAIAFFIFDDYEETLLEYIKRLERKADVFSVPGTIVKIKGRPVCNPSRGLIKPLDQLPFADYSDIPLNLYKEVFGCKNISISGSIGCTERCSFCSIASYRQEYIKRSAEHIASEMIQLRRRYGVNSFIFQDRLLNIDVDELEKLSELLISSGADLRWVGYAKVSSLMTKRLLKKMYASGCRQLFYGVESGSPKILRMMKKGFTPDEASQVLQDTAESHINSTVQIMTDFPGEGKKELDETIKFIEKNFSFISALRVNSFNFSDPGLAGDQEVMANNRIRENKNISKLMEAVGKIEGSQKNAREMKFLYHKKTNRLVCVDHIRSRKLKFLIKLFLSLVKKRGSRLS